MRKFLLVATVASIAAVGAHLAGATPGGGIVGSPVHARATLGADLMMQVAPGDGAGLQWRGRDWKAGELPEFLKMLRDEGKVENLGEWVALHPAAAGKLGPPASRRIAAADLAVQQITIAPFGTTGWHTHPGPALVLIKSGELTLYEGKDASCHGTVYKAGQSFVDAGFGNVHVGRNEGNGTSSCGSFTSLLHQPGNPSGSMRPSPPDRAATSEVAHRGRAHAPAATRQSRLSI